MAEKLTDEQYQEIVDKHPGVRLRRFMTAAGEVVIRAPTAVEESNFQTMYYGSSMHAGMAWRNLFVMVTVYPDAARLKSWLDSWTGISTSPSVIRELKIIRGEVLEEEGK
jgi:hypothetical protein